MTMIINEVTTKEEYDELCATIKYHMEKYYDEDEPEISDYEYDQLMATLKKAEKEHPEWMEKDSPTQIVGGHAKRENGVKVTHNVPMLSIEDVFNYEDVENWVDKVLKVHPDATFSVEEKIDGLSMTLVYENGKLIRAETRGNGFIGEDVTDNAFVIPDVKKTLAIDDKYLEIRGEVYMTHKNFDRYNEIQEKNGKDLAKNPRNLAAGTLRQLETKITKERGLNMFIFNIQDGSQEFMENHMNGLDKLNRLGVPVSFHKECKTKAEVIAAIEEIGARRPNLAYDIDGAVVKIVQTKYRDDFSASAKYSTGHIAYKYPPEVLNTKILAIEQDVGRTGKMTFRAKLEPIRLCGTIVQYVTLHNPKYIKDNGIGVGATVGVFKSGEIIPKIEKVVVAPEKVFEPSMVCPVCGQPLEQEDGMVDLYCINPACAAQLVRTISNFVSTNCMNIMGFGDTYIEDLVKQGYLTSYVDIYRLIDKKDELISKGIIGKEKNTTKLLENIEKSKTNDAVRLLTSLGIRNVGKGTAKDILENFDSIEDLAKASIDTLCNIPNVGGTTAQCIYDFFHNEKNEKMLEDLIALGVNTKVEKVAKASNALDGLTIVVTGTLPTMGRKEITEYIESNGGKVSGSVSKKTSYVVVGEDAGSKLEKAKALGIPTLTEDELKKLVNG